MKYSKLGAGATLFGIALVVTGCSQAGGSPAEPSSSASPGDSVSPSAPGISGTVTYWHAYSADSPEVTTLEDKIIPAFEALHPGVTVESVPVPYDDLHQKLITATAGAQLPDLVRSDIGWVPELANLGVLVPLSETMPDFQKYADEVFPGTLATNRWQGTYYGLPLDTNTRVMMYDADFLKSAGVEVPATVDDLVASAPALKAAGAYAFADNGAGGWNMLPWIWSNGGEITDPDVTVASGYLNSPASVAAIQTLVDLYADGYMPDIILGDSGGLATSDGLATDAYATILDGPWMYPIFAEQYPNFELSTAQVPAGDGGSISVVGGEDIVLTETSTNKEAAMEFMRYLLTEESQLAMAEVGQMPVIAGLESQLTQIHDYYGPFAEQLKTAKPRPATPAWAQIDTIMQEEIRAAISGDKSVQDALDAAATQADTLLAEYN